MSTENLLLYIDPGTGSMLFAVLIGVFGAIGYIVRVAWVKIRFKLTSGKKEEIKSDKIPYVIFSDDKRYWNTFEPICREFNERGIDVEYLTASEDDPGLNSGFEHVKARFLGEGNKAFSKLNFLNASVVLATTPGLEVYQWKRSRDVDYYIHIPHAAGEINFYRMFGLDYYDAVLIAGDFHERQIRKLEEMRGLPAKDLHMCGIPYMDEMVKRLKASGETPAHERTVLIAPTWGETSLFNKFKGEIIKALLDTGYHVIVRPHPQSFTAEKELMDSLMKEFPESDQLEWNRDRDNFEVLKRSDILISDFSGVVFDFALVYDKPVIYTDTEFDTSAYDLWWLDEDIWTLSALPKLGKMITADNLSDIKNLIDSCIESDEFAKGREEVRNECWQEYGNGTKNTVDYMVAKYNELNAKESK